MEHEEPQVEQPEEEQEEESDEGWNMPRELPLDLPRSLDDRRTYTGFGEETEYYDAWQGQQAHFETDGGDDILTIWQANRNSSQLLP